MHTAKSYGAIEKFLLEIDILIELKQLFNVIFSKNYYYMNAKNIRRE